MDSIKITLLTKEYEKQARELIEDGLKGYYKDFDYSLNDDINDLCNYYSKEKFFVALLDDEVVGTGAIIKECKGIARIVRVSVKKSYRKLGVGSKIVKYLEEVASKGGNEKIVLETTKTWEVAKKFYYNNGYKVESIDHEDFNFYKIIKTI